MVCVIALIVFSILGIFSATHRKLAKEAFNCVFRRITLRPCNTGFNEKIKAKIISKLLNKNIKLAKFINKYFEIISWIFVITFIISLIFTIKTIYSLVRYKTCNPENPKECILSPQKETGHKCENNN